MSIVASSNSSGFVMSEPSMSMVASSDSSGFVMPLGMKMSFSPTDSQLVRYFLCNSAPNFIITDCDLFGQEEPWEIWDKYLGVFNKYNPDELYLFMSSRKKLSPKATGCRISRTIGGGTWAQKEPLKLVYDDEDGATTRGRKSIGIKRKLRYHNQGSDHHTQWCLDEYTSLEVANSCAIFRLRKFKRQHKSPAGICVQGFIQPTLPLGMKIWFSPTDSQLVRYFLVSNFASNFIIYDCDLFGQDEPWEIWDKYSGLFSDPPVLYFFISSLKKMGYKGRGCNFERTVGSGTWNQKEASKVVYDNDDQERNPIGRKRKLRYVNQGSIHHGEWYLEEYTSLVDECAILLLKKNERCKSSSSESTSVKRKRRQIDQLEEKPRKKKANSKASRQLVTLQDSDSLDGHQRHTVTSHTVPDHHQPIPIQHEDINNDIDNIFPFFKDVDIGTWEFPSLDDFVMASPPLHTDCDQQALAALDFPSLDALASPRRPPALVECDQQALALVNTGDNHNLMEFCNDDDIIPWDFPIVEDSSMASGGRPQDECDQQALALPNADDNLHLINDGIATWDYPFVEDCSMTSLHPQVECDQQALSTLVDTDDDLHFINEDIEAWGFASVDDFLMASPPPFVDFDEHALALPGQVMNL